MTHFFKAMFVACFLTFFLTPCFSSSAKEYSTDDIYRLENKAVQKRLEIKNWHIKKTLDVEGTFDPDQKNAVFFMEHAADGIKSRNVSGSWEDGEKIYSYFVRDDEFDCTYRSFEPPFPEEKEFALQMARLETMESVAPPVDIRGIGFASSNFYTQDETTCFYTNQSRRELKMTDETLDGVPCYKVEFLEPDRDVRVRYWMNPAMDNVPVRMEFLFPENERKTTILFKNQESFGFWFPQEVFSSVVENGKELYHRKYQIEVLGFNTKLDPDLFTPKSCPVPKGTLVVVYPESNNDAYFWDGTQPVGESSGPLASRAAVAPARHSPLRLALAGCGFALIFFGCFLKYRSLRKKNRES